MCVYIINVVYSPTDLSLSVTIVGNIRTKMFCTSTTTLILAVLLLKSGIFLPDVVYHCSNYHAILRNFISIISN